MKGSLAQLPKYLLRDESDVSSHDDRRAQIGGLSLSELNALELEFLFAVDFDLGLHPSDYAACTADLAAFAARRRSATMDLPHTDSAASTPTRRQPTPRRVAAATAVPRPHCAADRPSQSPPAPGPVSESETDDRRRSESVDSDSGGPEPADAGAGAARADPDASAGLAAAMDSARLLAGGRDSASAAMTVVHAAASAKGVSPTPHGPSLPSRTHGLDEQV